jgi:ATP-binding cassette subfamily B protein
MANRPLVSVLVFGGSFVMVLRISWLLTVIAVARLPVVLWTTRASAGAANPSSPARGPATGALNSHLEDACSGHELVTAFGRWTQARRAFATHNDELRSTSAAAQFHSSSSHRR